MKNKILILFILIILLVISFYSYAKLSSVDNEKNTKNRNMSSETAKNRTKSVSNEQIRAVWIFYKELSTDNPDKKEYEKKISEIFANISSKGYNVAFVQVRAFSDAFYKSDYFKPTKYLCDGNVSFDALKIICKYAKKYGVSVHAWINPYRVSYDTNEKVSDTMLKTESGVYYNPASKDAQKLIINGVREIIENYDVSGIHIDDYFYPTDIGTADENWYSEYKKGGGTLEIDSWRRSNVNNLVKDIYSLIKSKDESLIFSISPGADIKKDYISYYADVYAWCGNTGYCDWIIPQIYFGFNNSNMPFSKTLSSWEALIKNNSVKLIPGLPAYKVGKEDAFAGDGKTEFVDSGKDVVKKQIEEVKSRKSCAGYAVYSYSYISEIE